MVAVICDTLGISALSKHFSLYCTPGLCSQIVHTALTLFYAGVSFLSVLLTAKPTMAGWEWRHQLQLPPLLSNIIPTRFVPVCVLDPPRSQL